MVLFDTISSSTLLIALLCCDCFIRVSTVDYDAYAYNLMLICAFRYFY